MWSVNNGKDRVKSLIISDVNSSITNLMESSNCIHEIISSLDRTLGGTSNGIDQRLIGECKMAQVELSKAIERILNGQQYIRNLETKEWVDDD